MGRGWEIQNRTHFDEIVANYDKTRPEYPAALFSDIFSYAHTSNSKKALEIGAGTGKATQSFLSAGYDVTAVEIGTNMAEFLQKRFEQSPNFKVINDSFEKAVLENETYDVIYAASAFHWVDASIGCPKALNLLKNEGTLALLRYNAVPADGESLYEEIQAVYEKYFHKPYTRPTPKTKEEYINTSEIFRGFRCKELAEYGFVDVTMNYYDVTRSFGADDYISLLDTMADHRSLAEANKAALYAGIKEAILSHGGEISVDYIFQLYMGRKREV